jgi:hypothetical protein
MTFLGLPLGTLAALFGVVSALTAVLYVLKLRRRAVAVPFARIWDSVLRDKESSELFSQLKRWLSLLLQLALVAAMVLALGDPRLGIGSLDGRNVVVLVDASASMKATDDAPSRLDRAKAEARRFVKGLGAADRAVIVQMDVLPTPLCTLTGEIAELDGAIDRVRAADTRADLSRALAFAADSLRGLGRGEIVLVTDGALELPRLGTAPPVPVSVIPVGKGDTNIAISEFSARRYPLDKSRVEVMLELSNTNDRPVDVELTLLGDGVVIDVSRLRLGANERLPRFYPDIAGASRKLEAQLSLAGGKRDDLPADDRAHALMPERKRARVLVVTRGNTYVEAALLLDEYLDVTYVEPAAYPPREAFDVTIFDGVAPERARHTGSALYLNPPAQGGPVPIDKPIVGFGFDTWDRRHPTLRFTALGDVQVAKGFRLRPDKADKILGASELGPILVAGTRSGQRFVVLAFDPRDSDFVLRPAWPLFVLGTIDHFVEEDTGYLSSYRTGESWRIPAPSSVDFAELVTPSGERVTVPVKEGRAAYFGDRAGFYTLKTGGADPTEHVFAANLSDFEESRIAPRRDLSLGKKPLAVASAGAPGVRRKLWAMLLLGVVVVSVVEWFTYHRRLTV